MFVGVTDVNNEGDNNNEDEVTNSVVAWQTFVPKVFPGNKFSCTDNRQTNGIALVSTDNRLS